MIIKLGFIKLNAAEGMIVLNLVSSVVDVVSFFALQVVPEFEHHVDVGAGRNAFRDRVALNVDVDQTDIVHQFLVYFAFCFLGSSLCTFAVSYFRAFAI